MDVALAEPDVHVLPAERPLDVGAEELVGAEQHLGVRGDRGDDVDGVRRRAADVGLGLHRRRRVDVADDDGAGVLGLPRPQLLGGDRLGQAAPGPLVGDQDRLVVGEDLRRLGHEVDAAEDDRRRLDVGRDPRQPERVADVVGDLLDLRQLVVVGQDHGVALAAPASRTCSAQSGGSGSSSTVRAPGRSRWSRCNAGRCRPSLRIRLRAQEADSADVVVAGGLRRRRGAGPTPPRRSLRRPRRWPGRRRSARPRRSTSARPRAAGRLGARTWFSR